jgi:hypothetical protein
MWRNISMVKFTDSAKKCGAKISLKNGSDLGDVNVKFFKVLRGLYCWV